jgi:hypothetical protein
MHPESFDFPFDEEDGRYMDDDGTELNPDLVAKPGLCLLCAKDEWESERILCNLNRLDQRDETEFKCFAYRPKNDNDIPLPFNT